MNKIKELRLERGWKQNELAQKLNVKSAAVSKYENGHIPLTNETISILCDIFDVSADYIIGRSEKRCFNDEQSIPDEIQTLIDSCSDLNKAELKKVIEYVDFLKTKRL